MSWWGFLSGEREHCAEKSPNISDWSKSSDSEAPFSTLPFKQVSSGKADRVILNKMADSELSAILSQRQIINEGNGDVPLFPNKKKYFNPYTEFKEFSMKEIKEYERMFKKSSPMFLAR
ncbi:hypothetical protein CEXT_290111 [Caerostris extrusa]|uniref:Uncharacterized protein n=1 Tax=Caerostris extrusa TaxID=172846 RepID=A0AAV4Y798_CAEEX|nr:hypothetical protein CEXT_290111 [Caerostris extrusa]